jgi:hypothetical protein
MTDRIDGEIAAVEEMVAELADIDRDWDELPESYLVGWLLDWDQAMGTFLRLLARAYHNGAMSQTQAERYRSLLTALKGALPILKRRDLRRPPVALMRP